MNKITADQALETLESLRDFNEAYGTLKSFIQQPTPRKLEGGNFSHEEVYSHTGTLPPERIEQVLAGLEKAQHQVAKLEDEIDGMVGQDEYRIMEKQLTREADELQGELRSLELAITGWLRHGFDPVEAGEILGAG